MPMIIKNGKRYCSTGGEAENVVYNNTESGLEATNMQDAIDELNSNFDFEVDSGIDIKTTPYTTSVSGLLVSNIQTSGKQYTAYCYVQTDKVGEIANSIYNNSGSIGGRNTVTTILPKNTTISSIQVGGCQTQSLMFYPFI